MKIHVGFLLCLLLCLTLSCAALPPQKDFTTELWQIDPINYTISRLNDNDEVITINIEDIDSTVFVVVELNDIVNEWKYEDLLINRCDSWR